MQITINILDDDVKYLENDLLDIEDWAQKAVVGKISKCKGRLLNEWQPKLLADPEIEMIPATESGLLATIIAHKDYKNRVVRDAEDKAQAEAQAKAKAQAKAQGV